MDKRFGDPSNQPGNNDPANNISPSDLLGLPPVQRKVMRVMLRYNEVDYPSLSKHLIEFESLSPDEIDQALAELVAHRWLFNYEDRGTVIYRAPVIDKSGALKKPTGELKAPPAITPPNPEANSEETRPSRRRSGLDRLNSFWDKVGANAEEPDQPQSTEEQARYRPSRRSGSLFDELSTPAAPPEKEKPKRESLFEELGTPAEKAQRGSLFDELKTPEPQKEPTPAGGTHVSNMFKELAVKGTDKEKKDTPSSVPKFNRRISSLFDELASKPKEETDNEPSEGTD